MPWITENDNTYWMPDVLPQPTEEYQNAQIQKKYLTKEGKEVMHPSWTYGATQALTDDEYMFQNEGWKVIIEENPTEPVLGEIHYIKNSPEEWEEIDEMTVKATYKFTGWIPETLPEFTKEENELQINKKYLSLENHETFHPQSSYKETGSYVDDEYLFRNKGWKLIIDRSLGLVEAKHIIKNSPELWEEIDEMTVKPTYTFIDFNEKELEEYKEQKWYRLRNKRDIRLQATDWIIIKATEQNLVVSAEVTSYRQQLRNFPETIADIMDFNLDDETLWPTQPTVYFEV